MIPTNVKITIDMQLTDPATGEELHRFGPAAITYADVPEELVNQMQHVLADAGKALAQVGKSRIDEKKKGAMAGKP